MGVRMCNHICLSSNHIQKNPTKIKLSPDYSPAFNIILRPSHDQNMDGLGGTHRKRSEQYKNIFVMCVTHVMISM